MSTTRTGLPPDQIFEPSGHVTDLCVTCVADGETALVPQAALDHLDACDACGARLGEAALRSLEVGEALAALPARDLAAAPAAVVVPAQDAVVANAVASGPPPSPRRLRRPLPIAAIAAALLVAALTAGPTLLDTVRSLPSLLATVIDWIPVLLQVGRALMAAGPPAMGPWALAVKAVSAGVFVLAGLSVARAATRRRAAMVEGGVR